MKYSKQKTRLGFVATALLTSLVIAGCGGSSSNSTKMYRITLTNVTANQPLSPATVILHKSGYHLWQAGSMASVALEKLAEGGSNEDALTEADADTHALVSKSGAGVIPPGSSQTIELEIDDADNADDIKITVAAMLVNTNDAFAGQVSSKIANLAWGESFNMHVPVWDAGTEANTESAGTIPGPADGGEGFNASRTGDVDFVAIHQGVVSHADGFASSVLNESHRFNNPVALLHVERID